MSVDSREAGLSNTQRQYMDDEIDLFELAESLWNNKLIIITTTLIFMFAGYGYTFFENKKPIVYEGKALLETGAYLTQEREIKNLHTPVDLAMMLSSMENVDAKAPNGSDTIIEVTTSNTDRKEVIATFDFVREYTEERDSILTSKLQSQQIIKATQAVAEPVITEKSTVNPTLVTILSIILGAMVGVFISLILSAITKRRQDQLTFQATN